MRWIMKTVLLIGLGRFGNNIAQKLYELKHEVMAVDIHEERVNAMLPFVTHTVQPPTAATIYSCGGTNMT